MDFRNDVIQWLLGDDNPPVRYLTSKHLLKNSKTADQSKKNLMDYTITGTILKNQKHYMDDDEKAYWKYKGKYWQLIFLGQFLASGADPAIKKMVEGLLSHRKWVWEISGQCLTANLLGAFMRLGYKDHPVVIEEREMLAKQIIRNNGILCHAMDYSLRSHCYMAIPKLLLCFAEVPESDRTPDIEKAIKILAATLIENDIYIYVSKDRKAWMKILENQPKKKELPEGQTVKNWILNQKKMFLDKHGSGGRVEKPGWLKFGFPLHYNSDILEAMLALTKLNIPFEPRLQKSLDIIGKKMTPEGKWVLENSLNGKMWADVEEKGKPSKWITLHSLMVLSHYNR